MPSTDGTMTLFDIELWAIWFAFGLMVTAAVINLATLRVPNWLSLPAVLAGWITAVLVSLEASVPSKGGGIKASLAATALSALVYSRGSIGVGCVKMQMAFGAWVGCALPLESTVLTTIMGAAVGKSATNLAVLVWKTRSKSKSREKEDQSLRQFPAQVTLSLGSIVGAFIPFAAGWI
jgi:Flp pilus assembly protein protease CpaA